MGAVSSVLLKNTNNVLPINLKSVKKLAIISSDAVQDPHGLNPCEYNGCGNGALAMGRGFGSANSPYLIGPLTGLTEAFGKKVKIQSYLNNWDLNAVADTAKGADYALIFSNSDSDENFIVVEGNAGDRNNLTLWHNDENMV